MLSVALQHPLAVGALIGILGGVGLIIHAFVKNFLDYVFSGKGLDDLIDFIVRLIKDLFK